MEKDRFDYIAERVDVLANAQSGTQTTKDAANAWKEAVADDGIGAADEATRVLIDILDGRPTDIEGVLAFTAGPAKEMFGEGAAAQMHAAQQKRKQAGAKWCDCPACTAATEILALYERVEL